MLYKLSLEKVRKKTITDAMFRVDDDVGKDCLTSSSTRKRSCVMQRERECPTSPTGSYNPTGNAGKAL